MISIRKHRSPRRTLAQRRVAKRWRCVPVLTHGQVVENIRRLEASGVRFASAEDLAGI